MFSMDNANKQHLALANFEAFRSHLPNSWDENEVSRFHKIVTELEDAYGLDLSSFRIPDAEMKPVLIGVSRIGRSGQRRPSQYSGKKYCDDRVAQRKVDGIVFYFQNLQPVPERPKVGF
jgi:hypothetical protein